ncbi:heat-inducible transcriptional repressor HrcA [Peptoniphilus catoniae]|uniref:heat-inducible transcriptional repressor HrcA n=1 Tax=Peptoniphilus catoniae TaxID=1660341 RepID=UPI0010FF613A|nr:heat-inducible transcriptional repressor HrcA [Peptoniphilus catoniae]
MDKRKIEILNAIINSYIDSSSPVGSRTLSKDFNLGVSSATIRNEMADLEDLGYLNKPHTSAGRVPSDKAYRFFVDELIRNDSIFEYDNEDFSHIEDKLLDDVRGMSDIYKNAVKVLADMTNSTSYLVSLEKSDTKIKLIQLVNIDENTVLLIIVGDKGVVDHQRIDLEEPIDDFVLSKISDQLNEYLVGVDFEKISKIKIVLKGDLVRYSKFILDIVAEISKFNDKITASDFYYDGLTNILNYKEYFDVKRAQEFMSFIQNEDSLLSIISDPKDDTGFSVIIGNENSNSLLRNNSIIKSSFGFKNKARGVLGVIGPIRMNYKKHVRAVWAVSYNLTKTINSIVR